MQLTSTTVRFEATVTLTGADIAVAMSASNRTRPQDAAEAMTRSQADAIAATLGSQVVDLYAVAAYYHDDGATYKFSIQLAPLDAAMKGTAPCARTSYDPLWCSVHSADYGDGDALCQNRAELK